LDADGDTHAAPGAVRAKIGWFRALARYFRDPKAGFFGKAFVFLAIGYVLMPIDLIPDVAPIIGWLDDLGVVGLAIGHLAKKASEYRERSAIDVAPVERDTSPRVRVSAYGTRELAAPRARTRVEPVMAEFDDAYADPVDEAPVAPLRSGRMSEEELLRRFRELEKKV
jgi:uncharacterized membrane protein YkvA (DUF1232 family)